MNGTERNRLTSLIQGLTTQAQATRTKQTLTPAQWQVVLDAKIAARRATPDAGAATPNE